MLGQLAKDFLGISVLSVDLVDGHNNRHFRRPSMIESLHGLGHHAVVCGHHQDDDVG